MKMASRRPATVAMTLAVVVITVMAAAVERAEAGQNCICECVKLCMRTRIPVLEQCTGKCRENSCIKSCEEACDKKGFPKIPIEGIQTCEIEPLTADEERMLLLHK